MMKYALIAVEVIVFMMLYLVNGPVITVIINGMGIQMNEEKTVRHIAEQTAKTLESKGLDKEYYICILKKDVTLYDILTGNRK
jgi:hypothetical protein